jgi:hypothetical protein
MSRRADGTSRARRQQTLNYVGKGVLFGQRPFPPARRQHQTATAAAVDDSIIISKQQQQKTTTNSIFRPLSNISISFHHIRQLQSCHLPRHLPELSRLPTK